MPVRPFTPVSEAAYERLGQAITRWDKQAGWPVATLLQAMHDPLDPYTAPLAVGWDAVLNADTCPAPWLPWLAQAVGETIPPGTPEEVARAIVKNPPGWLAGTPAALKLACMPHLTGTRYVGIQEHFQGDPWRVNLVTWQAETPDPAALLAAAQAAVEAGFQVTHTVESGWTWNDLAESGLTWDEVARMTYDQLATIVPGTSSDEIRERYP